MFLKLSLFFFTYFAGIGIYVIFLPKILVMVGYNKIEIGVILSISPLMRFLIPFLFLKFIQLNKRVFYISLIVSLLSASSFYLTIENFYLFTLSNIFLGGSLGLILPYIETYSLNYLKKERYGKSRLYGSLGFMLIGLILARYLKEYQIGIDYYLVMLLIAVFVGYLITNNNQDFIKEEKLSKIPFSLSSNKNIWISIFLMQVSFASFYSFFTIYETERGISLITISYLWSFSIICEMLLFQFQNLFLNRFKIITLINFSILITSIRWLILFLFPSSLFWLYLSQSFHAFSFALYHTVTLTYLYKIYQNRQLASQFYYGFGYGLGSFLGSLLSGYFYGEYIFLISSIIAFIAFLFMDRESRNLN